MGILIRVSYAYDEGDTRMGGCLAGPEMCAWLLCVEPYAYGHGAYAYGQ